MLKVRARYAPGSCDYEGRYHEIRWDLSGCNLRCAFCWSPASRPLETDDPTCTVTSNEVVAETLKNLGDKSHTFIRFTGGEPMLQWAGVAEAVIQLQSAINPPWPPILFQTNGIEIGNGTVSVEPLVEDQKQLYLFEVSLKGTNSDEFMLLTSKSAELYDYQLAGYQRLLEVSRLKPNVRVVAVLGVYHSSTKGLSKYAFVNSSSGELLFDDYKNWDPRFSALWRTTSLKWVEPLRMSPLGVWRNLLRRCGSDGAGILRDFPEGTPNNVGGLFPAKPKSAEYARQIVKKHFWR